MNPTFRIRWGPGGVLIHRPSRSKLEEGTVAFTKVHLSALEKVILIINNLIVGCCSKTSTKFIRTTIGTYHLHLESHDHPFRYSCCIVKFQYFLAHIIDAHRSRPTNRRIRNPSMESCLHSLRRHSRFRRRDYLQKTSALELLQRINFSFSME